MDKQYTMGEICKLTNTPREVIRYWIHSGYMDVPTTKHSKTVDRYVFSEKDLSDIRRVKLLRKLHFSLSTSWFIVKRDLNIEDVADIDTGHI